MSKQNTYVRMHFIRDEINKGTLELKKVHTSGNLADMMIKPLLPKKYWLC